MQRRAQCRRRRRGRWSGDNSFSRASFAGDVGHECRIDRDSFLCRMSGNNDEALMTNDEGMMKSVRKNEDFEEAFWDDRNAPMIREEPSDKCVYDLEERTARFGEAVIDFTRRILQNAV